jgi:hypothetical protein
VRGDAGSVRRVQRGCVLLRRNADFEFDDEELESKLVWIFGSPRTGSTWLLEMLCHPLKVDSRSEIGFRWRDEWTGEAAALPVDEFRIASHLVASSGAVTLENGVVGPDSINFFFRSFSSYAFSAAYEDVWRPEARRFMLIRLYAVIERAREAGLKLPADLPALLVKEVNSSHGADLVMSLLPRSKMIFLVRDGRDVLDSLLDGNRPGGWLLTGVAGGFNSDDERHEFVRENSRSWVARTNVCMRAYENHSPDLRRRVRYEDLIADTEGCLSDLAGWLGISNGPRRITNVVEAHSFAAVPEKRKGQGKIIRSATPGGWRQGLDPEEQEIAREIMGDSLAELGYER